MKRNLFLLILFCITLLACTNDDDKNTSNNKSELLIGEWLRSDFNNNQQFKLSFKENNSGLKINVTVAEEGTASSASPFKWTVNNAILTIQPDGEVNTTITPFEFKPNGNLLLADYSEFEFIKQ